MNAAVCRNREVGLVSDKSTIYGASSIRENIFSVHWLLRPASCRHESYIVIIYSLLLQERPRRRTELVELLVPSSVSVNGHPKPVLKQ